VPLFGAFIWSLCCWIGISLVHIFGALLDLEPIFGAFIWCLYLGPIFGAYFWNLYLEPIFGASCVGARGAFCSKALNKGTKWCFYLVPSWLGALLISGAFLKIRCSVASLVEKGTSECDQTWYLQEHIHAVR
jgi:hypothetical protein